jgi:hypothetical protein
VQPNRRLFVAWTDRCWICSGIADLISLASPPAGSLDTPWWLETSPTHRRAIFDHPYTASYRSLSLGGQCHQLALALLCSVLCTALWRYESPIVGPFWRGYAALVIPVATGMSESIMVPLPNSPLPPYPQQSTPPETSTAQFDRSPSLARLVAVGMPVTATGESEFTFVPLPNSPLPLYPQQWTPPETSTAQQP